VHHLNVADYTKTRNGRRSIVDPIFQSPTVSFDRGTYTPTVGDGHRTVGTTNMFFVVVSVVITTQKKKKKMHPTLQTSIGQCSRGGDSGV
jgi:hypothetical protein